MQYLVILGMFVAALSLVGCDRPEKEVAKEAPTSQPARAEESVQAPVASDEPEPAEPEPLVENAEGEPLPLDSMTIEEKEGFLFDSVTPEKGEFPSAAWEIFFPTPNENWGHQFEADGAYTYWDHSAEAIQRGITTRTGSGGSKATRSKCNSVSTLCTMRSLSRSCPTSGEYQLQVPHRSADYRRYLAHDRYTRKRTRRPRSDGSVRGSTCGVSTYDSPPPALSRPSLG